MPILTDATTMMRFDTRRFNQPAAIIADKRLASREIISANYVVAISGRLRAVYLSTLARTFAGRLRLPPPPALSVEPLTLSLIRSYDESHLVRTSSSSSSSSSPPRYPASCRYR